MSPKSNVPIGALAAEPAPRGPVPEAARPLTGDGALLELALLNLAMSLATRNGLRPVIPPALVGNQAMSGTGFLGQAAENVYRLDDDDLYLVGTAEVIYGQSQNEIDYKKFYPSRAEWKAMFGPIMPAPFAVAANVTVLP